MLNPPDIVGLADLPQRQIAAAIKIAAALISRGAAISEAEARSLIKMDDLAWTHAKSALSKHFVFSRGRIAFPSDAEPLDPLDLASPEDLDKMQKRLDKHFATKAAAPLTPIQQVLYSLGGMTERQAVSFYHSQAATYGHQAVIDAINVAAETRPGEPKAYIIAILRRAARSASVAPAAAPKRFPLKILRYKPPPNPEAASTELIGWESPAPGATADALWPTGVRRKIYRLPTGELAFVPPGPCDVVPTADADPGCIVLS